MHIHNKVLVVVVIISLYHHHGKVVVNWEESIAYCNHVLKQLNNRLEILQNSLEELNRCEEKSQLQKYEEYYKETIRFF